MQSFLPHGLPKSVLALLAVSVVTALALTATLVHDPTLRFAARCLLLLSAGLVIILIALSLTKRALSKYLVPSWSGKWNLSILGKYLGLTELLFLARLVASGRWEFNAVPSVRKKGITIELKGKATRDKDLVSPARLRTVHVLILADCPVTDSGLAQLTPVCSLECIVLSRTPVTAAGLAHLQALPGLKTLDVDGTSISDSALAAVGLLDKKFSLSLVEEAAREEKASAPSDAFPLFIDILEINRRLAAMRPDVCLPDLATTLNNLGWGRESEAAVLALQESVAINRQLAATSSEHHLGALYISLSNLGFTLEKLGRDEDALAACREAVDVYRQFPSKEPSQDVAGCLQRLGDLCRKLNRHEEAVEAMRESADMYRQCVAIFPDAWMLRSWFVSSLNALGKQLHLLDRNEEALAVVSEAVEVSRPKGGRRLFPEDLVTSLNNLGKILGAVGRKQEAEAAIQEAARLERRTSR